jgi:transcription elongation GreA/GreB family factor
VDELNTEVKVQEERVRGVALKHFLDTMVIIRKDSVLEKLVRGQSVAAYASREAFEKEAVECLTGAVEVSAALVKSILVPGVMDEKAYSAIFDPAAASKAAEAAKPAAPPAGSAAYRWDNSRSIAELEGRLAAAESLKVDDDEVNHANVVNLLSRDCHRTDLADKWAACVAIIRKSDLFNQRLSQLLGELKERVAAWKDTDLFVTICDKMPGKLVPFWMACSYEAMGAAFLASTTVKMPFRLWIHTERLLNQNKEGALFGETVFQAFQQGSPSADHYVWLWKAPKSELRTKYLADSYMLFKTLHLDVRGNYLKSRREVHKLLMDSEPFQRALMNDGDETAVRNLIRCVNHLPLLEGNEKQSLLVKIVRIFPAMKGLVESAGASNSRAAGKTVPRLRLTSMRSYVRTRAEYDNLVNVQIPANTTAIETARAHGDLSENSEYKYAKEQQRFLNGRRASLEKELNTVKPFDFSEQQVEKIIIPGCVVTLHYLADGHEEVINLLGIFDGDSERSFYSYDSPMGRVLMTRSTGERITVPSGLEATIASVKPLPQDIIDELNNTDI